MNKKTLDLLLSDYSPSLKGDGICLDSSLIAKFVEATDHLLNLDYYFCPPYTNKATTTLEEAETSLLSILRQSGCQDPELLKDTFINKIPQLRRLLKGSLTAIVAGDPAVDSPLEIVLSYPGYKAILHHRIAHALYEEGQFFLARLVSERAHSLTGIDIHPGANIGEDFFIDHGTGIVIGETTSIGKGVKIYQGVTLGALSLREGSSLKGKKRHPTIEDNVTIYANASILGGDVVIGEGSTIGGGVYVKRSVPPHSIVTMADGVCLRND